AGVDLVGRVRERAPGLLEQGLEPRRVEAGDAVRADRVPDADCKRLPEPRGAVAGRGKRDGRERGERGRAAAERGAQALASVLTPQQRPGDAEREHVVDRGQQAME